MQILFHFPAFYFPNTCRATDPAQAAVGDHGVVGPVGGFGPSPRHGFQAHDRCLRFYHRFHSAIPRFLPKYLSIL